MRAPRLRTPRPIRAEGRGGTELTVDNCRSSCGDFDEDHREHRTYRIVVRRPL
ncbi:hypothetical protein [Kitasatospora sp. NPDC088783]|uniref:hypothetical protein n=1 Tax=Kitasatospora sp. NPDC088783 TaxID=3364077 RepID=UPI0038042A54